MSFIDLVFHDAPPSHNKAYALHSLSVVRAAPNRGEKTAATSHKQSVMCNAKLNAGDIGK
jgi:hypothetical protein